MVTVFRKRPAAKSLPAPYHRLLDKKTMHNNRGFTLIEILVAMVVLAIGLLGLAGLQANGLRNSQTAYFRSQAARLAYDMADRMRANTADAGALDTSVYITTTPTDAAAQNCITTGGCSPTEMAEQDLFEWNSNLAAALPGGQGSIAVTGSEYAVTVRWDDNRDGTVSANNPAEFLQLRFQL
jgi:type IV pilus assembly protein PilV